MATSRAQGALKANGRKFRRWDRVRFLKASAGLLRGLPRSDQQAILGAVGRVYRVRGVRATGHAELEFFAPDGTMHFVWVEPESLRLVRSAKRAAGSHLTPRSRGTRRKRRAPHRGR